MVVKGESRRSCGAVAAAAAGGGGRGDGRGKGRASGGGSGSRRGGSACSSSISAVNTSRRFPCHIAATVFSSIVVVICSSSSSSNKDKTSLSLWIWLARSRSLLPSNCRPPGCGEVSRGGVAKPCWTCLGGLKASGLGWCTAQSFTACMNDSSLCGVALYTVSLRLWYVLSSALFLPVAHLRNSGWVCVPFLAQKLDRSKKSENQLFSISTPRRNQMPMAFMPKSRARNHPLAACPQKSKVVHPKNPQTQNPEPKKPYGMR